VWGPGSPVSSVGGWGLPAFGSYRKPMTAVRGASVSTVRAACQASASADVTAVTNCSLSTPSFFGHGVSGAIFCIPESGHEPTANLACKFVQFRLLLPHPGWQNRNRQPLLAKQKSTASLQCAAKRRWIGARCTDAEPVAQKWDEQPPRDMQLSCVLLAGLGARSVQRSNPSRGGALGVIPGKDRSDTGRRHWR
jgi:hypothetical protein